MTERPLTPTQNTRTASWSPRLSFHLLLLCKNSCRYPAGIVDVAQKSSSAITTTPLRPRTVTCWGPSLLARRTTSLRRAFASWNIQCLARADRFPIVLGRLRALDFVDLVILTTLLHSANDLATLRSAERAGRRPCRYERTSQSNGRASRSRRLFCAPYVPRHRGTGRDETAPNGMRIEM
jgi:hypothetical protein